MAVTRLKRKDRKNKNTSRQEVKTLKLATNLELGSRSRQSTTDQLAINNAILAKLSAQS
ncbi:spore protein [Pedobacter sp.]|uniref:spore protein n=1 Tax=Pedobacter sp. TaxID=1411316 RepID=UPI003D7F21C1